MAHGSLVARLALGGHAVRLDWRDGVIEALAPVATAPDGVWLAPTLFDPQVNGYAGVDFQQDDLDGGQLERAVAGLRESACGGFLATLITCPWETLLARLRRLRALRDASPPLAAAIAGWHIEGPFLSPEPGFRGAHDARSMLDPDAARLRELRAAAGDLPLLLTLAPERPGAIAAIAAAVALGMTVSLGHTDAPAPALAAAIAAGARAFTHLGNGIPRSLDRHDNLLWRVLDAPPGLCVGVIPDGIHVSPPLFRLLHRLLPDIHYTTDAMAAAGMPPGTYRLGDLELAVGADQVVRMPGAATFAGSALTPREGVRRAAVMLGCPWQEAWARAALVPRRLLGLPEPLARGSPADFCVLGPDGPAGPLRVVIGGREPPAA